VKDYRKVGGTLVGLAMAGALATHAGPAVGAGAPKIRIANAWARPGLAMAATPAMPSGHTGMKAMPGNSAIYMVIYNDGTAGDRLVGGATEVARTVELHRTTVEGGMAQMVKVAGIDVPARGTVALKPGGLHVMLIGLKRDLKAGETFPVTLTFQRSGQVRLLVQVRAP
jgi:copper(I)-binding protein